MRRIPDPDSIPASNRGGVLLERRALDLTRPDRGTMVGLAQTFRGTGVRVIVTHRHATVSYVKVCEGRIAFPLAAGEVLGPREFVLVVAERSVLPMRFDDAVVESWGCTVPAGCGEVMTSLRAARGDRPTDAAAARRACAAPLVARLDADVGLPDWLPRARLALHDALAHVAPVRHAARAAGVSPETLSRAFARAYGISPKHYCHRARLFTAVLSLLSGRPVLGTALACGFNDVSRFYAQFRKHLGMTPARLLLAGRSRTAKTPDNAAATL